LLGGSAVGRTVAVLCGTGGNGGDGMVAARHLQSWGALPRVWITREPDPDRGVAAHQLAILRRLGIPVLTVDNRAPLERAELLIDALLGFSLAGAPTGATAELIRLANRHLAPALAVDLPSGLDATSGLAHEPCIRAAATLTLALPKTGLLLPEADRYVGELTVADIGVPPEAYRRIGKPIPPVFAAGDFLPIRRAR
jgi:NAD(P)H-hydrate epimerase